MIDADKPHLWKPDMIASVVMSNEWFLEAAPKAYREFCAIVVDQVGDAFMRTSDPDSITLSFLQANLATISTRGTSAALPITRDRLVGLSRSTSSSIKNLESGGIGTPVLIEAKSAGDPTKTNERRNEGAQKVHQFRYSYGAGVSLPLFHYEYFDSGHLGYEAAEGIDWVWELGIDDLAAAGV